MRRRTVQPVGFEGERRRWRVRLRDDLGRVVGAGTMLDPWHVLTCAHVVEDAREPEWVTVDFVGLTDAAFGRASVLEGGWIPPTDDGRGDIALLRLEKPEPGVFPAPLFRMPLDDHQPVRAFGFPAGADDGLWSLGRLVGEGGPGCEWIQFNRNADAEPIGRGFSGTAVLDEATSRVVGMVVGRYTGEGDRVGWMIPVETMLGYLPQLRQWAGGSPALDETFAGHAGAVDLPLVRRLADWFTHTGTGAVEVIVTGGENSATANALRLGVVLADRERSLAVSDLPDGVGQPPPVGSVDLAVDASGKTVDDIRHRIDERLIPGAGPRTVVVDRIDDAVEPDRLITEVLKPMADEAGSRGLRLLLAFNRTPTLPWSPSWPEEDDLDGRLDALDKDVAELAAIEEHQLVVATRFTGVAMIPPRAKRLQAAVRQLRSAVDDGDTDWAQRHVGRCEDSAAPALAAARKLRTELDGLLDHRRELRARLAGYAEMARHHGLLEDPELTERYTKARLALYEGPCNLADAEVLVDAYVDAVGGRGEGRA